MIIISSDDFCQTIFIYSQKSASYGPSAWSLTPSILDSEQSFTYNIIMQETYKKQITGFYRKHKRMPSYSEIMELVGFKSKNAVYKLINKLKAENFLSQDPSGRLLPKRIFGDLKVLGTVEAGFPSPAEEELADTLTLDEYLIENKEASFLLKVQGDSMKDAGIMSGDMVIVQRNLTPKNGDIVVAEVDGDWTMKYYQKQGQKIVLVPANAKFQPIIPKQELKIAAVVKAVVRKY